MSDSPLLLTLDLGTTNCKVVAFELDGSVAVRVERSYPSYAAGGGAYLQRPDEWIEVAGRALADAAVELGERLALATGLALSAWGPALVLLSGGGDILNEHSPTWQDQRSSGHGRRLLEHLGPDWIGGGIPLSGFPARLAWAIEEWPAAAAQAAAALGAKDLLIHWLTGRIATEPSSGPYAEGWPEDVFSFIGWPGTKLPEVVASTAVAGRLAAARAAELGLPAGLPVVAGLNDGASATLGSGCLRPGDAVISLGTNGVLRMITGQQPPAATCLAQSLFRYPYVEGRWVTGGFELSGGDSLRWLLGATTGAAPDDEQAYDTMFAEAAAVPAGSDGVLFLPYLVGRGSPHPDPSARAAFLGLRSAHQRGHLVRAVLEGVAFALYDVAVALEGLGQRLRRLVLTGGGARAALWREIIAGVFGRPVEHSSGDSNLGAAIVLAVGLGLHESFDQAVAKMTSTAAVEPSATEAYALGYERFREASARDRRDGGGDDDGIEADVGLPGAVGHTRSS